ncbi:TIGR03086 family metal-binding protein [Nocardia pseudovaccinii]|uniref:TIGR03086 family metal-binding protein n=1 Tax=Nocardia pseudovaccinii TaxID=189540 RepID=UPI0007A3D334|nr:TIGR03086 family metal-binding protein [Nocardia pseudovaccinii]
MDVAALYIAAVDRFGVALSAVKPEQWDAPTPCTEWDVRALVDHVINNHRRLAAMVSITLPENSDPVTGWHDLTPMLREIWDIPGVLDRQAPNSQLTIGKYALMMTTDTTAHTWDLARAIGVDENLDEQLVTALLPGAQQTQPMLAAAGLVGPGIDVPPHSSPQIHLLALLGRDARR